MTAKQRAFLAAYARLGTISYAAQAARINRRAHYDWLAADTAYGAAFEEAKDEAADRMEKEAIRRAVTGTRKPVYQGGKEVGAIQTYSDLLLMFLLKGARPAKFRERFEHSGPDGAPLSPTLAHEVEELSRLTDDELDQFIRLKRKLAEPGGSPGVATPAITPQDQPVLPRKRSSAARVVRKTHAVLPQRRNRGGQRAPDARGEPRGKNRGRRSV